MAFNFLRVSVVHLVCSIGCGAGMVSAAGQPGERPITGTPVRAAASHIFNFAKLAEAQAVTNGMAQFSRPKPFVVSPPKRRNQTVPFEAAPSGSSRKGPLPELMEPSPSPTQTFHGPGGTLVVPADCDGAVGLTKVMSGVNTGYMISDKTTGYALSVVSFQNFWSTPSDQDVFDPRTVYDPINNRWIAIAASAQHSPASALHVGISQTADPSGSWFTFQIYPDQDHRVWVDFPRLGFNKNWVAIAENLYGVYDNSIQGQLLLVDYAQLRNGTFSAVTVNDLHIRSEFPSITYSATESTLDLISHDSSFEGFYHISRVTGTVSQPVYTVGQTGRRGMSWQDAGLNVLPQSPPESGSSVCSPPCGVEAPDAAVDSAPVFRAGALYYAQTILLSGTNGFHTAVLWTKLDAASAAVLDGGVIEDPSANATNGGRWYAYASIAVNAYGDIIAGFSQFSSAQHPSAAYAFHGHSDPPGTMRDPVVYMPGEDYYHKQVGSGRNRWGDYSKAQVDPSNDVDLWVFQEYALGRFGQDDGETWNNSSVWGTWWARISPWPRIVAPAWISGKFQFRFETVSGVSYLVEYKDSLTASAWQAGQVVPGDGTTRTITNIAPAGTAQRFFRLRTQ